MQQELSPRAARVQTRGCNNGIFDLERPEAMAAPTGRREDDTLRL